MNDGPPPVQRLTLPKPGDAPRAAAHAYVALGFPVVQLCQLNGNGGCTCPPKKHAPDKAGKAPRRKGWETLGTTAEEVSEWWRGKGWDRSNVGLVMGSARRLVALDIDGDEGRASLAALEAQYGPLPPTLTNSTGGGGEHRVFVATEGQNLALILNRAGKLAPGLDVRSTGGQIVAAPSFHLSGKPYQWTDTRAPVPLPQWLYELMVARTGGARRTKAEALDGGEGGAQPALASNPSSEPATDKKRRYLAWLNTTLPELLSEVRNAPETTRFDGFGPAVIRAARHAIGAGTDLEALARDFIAAGVAAGRPEADCADEARRAIALAVSQGAADLLERSKSAPTRRASNAARPAPEPPRDDDQVSDHAPTAPAPESQSEDPDARFKLTDYGNAERLVRAHGNDLRYCPSWGTWLVWDGARWKRDETGEVVRRAKRTVRLIHREVEGVTDTELRQRILSHAAKSEGAARLTAMVQLAQSEHGMSVLAEDLDADPWLFNCLNGTLDLRTGERHPHRRNALCTKIAPVHYDPTATSEVLEKFLRVALDGDTEAGVATIDYLWRAAGYTLTGDTSEEVLFFAYGPGGSGKSTWLEAIRATLGDYAMTAPFELFLKQPPRGAHGATPDLARLRGARFVGAVETEEGERLSAGAVKALTGGDTVTARECYERGFDFKPTFKLWLAANHAPKVDDRDAALFRRMRRVPFPHGRDDEAQRDKSIKAALVNPRVSGAAILARAVQGCLAWQRDGLKTPAAVKDSTAAYRAENDPLAVFFAARVKFDKEASVARSVLYAEYEAWVRDEGSGGKPLAPVKFIERLRAQLAKEHGDKHEPEKSVRLHDKPVRGWDGVRLRDALLDAPAAETAAPAPAPARPHGWPEGVPFD